MKQIAVRMEGGLGDVLLGNRFIPAIKELHPDAEISAFIDSNGGHFNRTLFQEEALLTCYPKLYKSVTTLPPYKSNFCVIQHNYGRENYITHLSNIPDSFHEEITKYDKFYDLHVDSLSWMRYDFDWFKYHANFPRPHPTIEYKVPQGDYAVINLYTKADNPHNIEYEYTRNLINSLSQSLDIYCLASDATIPIYQNIIEGNPRCHLIKTSIAEACRLIEGSRAFIGVDSGFKYLAWAYSKPCLIYTMYTSGPHQALPPFKLRWLPVDATCLPPNYDLNYSLNFLQKQIVSRAFLIAPTVGDVNDFIDRFSYAINRI